MAPPDSLSRYSRQMLLPGFGPEGQERLATSRVLVAGCGALGCAIADALCRAGVGTLIIVDRDLVELTNLQRQCLFGEADVDVPKAIAAERRLRAVNSATRVEPHVVHLSAATLPPLAHRVDAIVDGLDNFETRYLLNDHAVATGTAYVYGGAVGLTGMSMTILPTRRQRRVDAVRAWDVAPTPCLRCIFPDAPPPGSSPTCDTVGVLGPVVSIVAAVQSAQTLRLLVEGPAAIDRRLMSVDLVDHQWRFLNVGDVGGAGGGGGPRDDCPCCGLGRFDRLDGREGDAVTSLCGRHAIQIAPATRGSLDLNGLAQRLQPHATVVANRHLCRATFATERGDGGEPIELTVFVDGRAIVRPTTDPVRARGIYDRYVGG